MSGKNRKNSMKVREFFFQTTAPNPEHTLLHENLAVSRSSSKTAKLKCRKK